MLFMTRLSFVIRTRCFPPTSQEIAHYAFGAQIQASPYLVVLRLVFRSRDVWQCCFLCALAWCLKGTGSQSAITARAAFEASALVVAVRSKSFLGNAQSTAYYVVEAELSFAEVHAVEGTVELWSIHVEGSA